MQASKEQPNRTKLGLRYLLDTSHYRFQDAQMWAFEQEKLGAAWVLLQAPEARAIPETFLTPLIQAGISPVLQFNVPMDAVKAGDGYQVLFSHYARNHVKYVILFDKPNLREKWTNETWAQEDLVERFLDQFLPMAELALYEGLIPVFPGLQPGGDYWDLAFFRTALQSMLRRGYQRLLENMAVAVYATASNRPLDWGAGGLDRWPGVRPYKIQSGVQDQRGFRIFDWYLDICGQELGRNLPMFLLQTGCQLGDEFDVQYPPVDNSAYVERNLNIIRWLHHEADEQGLSGTAPNEILAGFFDLSAFSDHLEMDKIFSNHQTMVEEIRKWSASHNGQLLTKRDKQVAERPKTKVASKSGILKHLQKKVRIGGKEVVQAEQVGEYQGLDFLPQDNWTESLKPAELFQEQTNDELKNDAGNQLNHSSISHYVLLPLYAWGAADWDMELIAPLLQDQHPTIGFSLTEACMADRVTVVGGKEIYSDQMLRTMRQAGCMIERLMPDGTFVAT